MSCIRPDFRNNSILQQSFDYEIVRQKKYIKQLLSTTIISGGMLLLKHNNGDDEMHTMTMINKHEGTEEWLCSSCGRHLLVSWYPNFKRIVLETGDPFATHSGFKGDFSLEKRIAIPVDKTHQSGEPEQPVQPVEDPRLRPWIMWMDEVGFENLWNRGGR